MCVIVHQPAGKYLAKDQAKNMWDRNRDGGGFAYISGDSIKVEKAMTFDRWWRLFERARSKNRDTDFLAHFRIATSGKIGLANSHPYEIDQFTVMAHNGMLNHIVGEMDLKHELSDTRVFIRDVLSQLPHGWLDNPVLVDMVEDYIGYSKLMFLTVDPGLQKNVYILNESKGAEVEGMWVSNTQWKPLPKATVTTTRQSGYWVNNVWHPSAEKAVTYVSKSKESDDSKIAKSALSEMYKTPLPSCDPLDEVATRLEMDIREQRRKEVESFWSGKPSEEIFTPTNDEAELMAMFKEIRKDVFNLTTDLLFDPVSEEVECQTCFTLLDEEGDCQCWELICIACGRMAPYCVHDPEDADFFKVNEAHKAFLDRAEVGQRPDKKGELVDPI